MNLIGAEGIASKTLPSEANIDASIPGNNKIYAKDIIMEPIDYLVSREQKIYTFALYRKMKFSDPTDPLREYTYDSQYFGVGAQGVSCQGSNILQRR